VRGGGGSSRRRALGVQVARRRMWCAKGKWLPKIARRYEQEGEGREGRRGRWRDLAQLDILGIGLYLIRYKHVR
jgi:hypothetical protein